jgi:ubiquitin-conjugating enzyme E2 H
MKDVRDLADWCKGTGNTLVMEDEDPPAFTVTMTGPEETPYAGGVFTVSIQLLATYPIASPSVVFRTKIWHPNIERECGSVCLDVLRERWTPITTLVSVVETYLPELLRHPNKDSPLNSLAASMMDNAKDYADYVRLYTRRYALNEAVELTEVEDDKSADYDSEM